MVFLDLVLMRQEKEVRLTKMTGAVSNVVVEVVARKADTVWCTETIAIDIAMPAWSFQFRMKLSEVEKQLITPAKEVKRGRKGKKDAELREGG
jgi:hypothetical protein